MSARPGLTRKREQATTGGFLSLRAVIINRIADNKEEEEEE